MSTDTKILKFIKPWRGYNAGEIAGFDATTADALLRGQVAQEQDGSDAAQRHPARRRSKAPGDSPQSAVEAAAASAAEASAGDATERPSDDTPVPATGADDARP